MKPLLVLARITFVGCLWSIIFIEGVRVIMLENWRFDIFWPLHWVYAWNLWLSGWVIDTAKEWAFVLILVAFLPLWLTGWITLSLIAWESLAYKIISWPLQKIREILSPVKIVKRKAPVVVKKKSYKEIRPTGPRAPIYDYNDSSDNVSSSLTEKSKKVKTSDPFSPKAKPSSLEDQDISPNPLKNRTTTARETFSHSLLDFDDEEDFELDFGPVDKTDIFAPKEEKSSLDDFDDQNSEPEDFGSGDTFAYEPVQTVDEEEQDTPENSTPRRQNTNNRRGERNNRSDNRSDNRNDQRRNQQRERRDEERQPRRADQPVRSGNPVSDVLTQKGYDVISNITVRNTLIDFLGVSKDKICVCLIDKEPGDWLADEERFNNEEPLWFSESSHRISPVRKVTLVSDDLKETLEEEGFIHDVEPYVIIQTGNIINAEDMFEIWQDMGVELTRINRGSPKDIKLFSKTVPEVSSRLDRNQFNRLKKLLKS